MSDNMPMSYDLNVWMCTNDGTLTTLTELGFSKEHGAFCRSSRNWQLSVNIDPVDPEDVPDEVFPKLPGIRFLASVLLEPIGAPTSARNLARKTARALAEAGTGAVEDPQTGAVKLASSAKLLLDVSDAEPEDERSPSLVSRILGGVAKSATDPRISELTISWWVDHDRLCKRDGMERFLDVVARHLPEALPRRYGPYEPPRFKYEETGRDAFIEFLLAEDMGVIYPTRPCTAAQYPVGLDRIGWKPFRGKRAFRAGLIEIGFDASILDQPHWRLRLPAAWRAISEVVQPFYGEARLLGGRIPGRGTLFHDQKTESHPVFGPWWRGVPERPAIARVIGPAYSKHWPAIEGTSPGALAFLESADWRHPDASVNKIPKEIVQPGPVSMDGLVGATIQDTWADKYPKVFPFSDGAP